jgi:hypothetical protein
MLQKCTLNAQSLIAWYEITKDTPPDSKKLLLERMSELGFVIVNDPFSLVT